MKKKVLFIGLSLMVVSAISFHSYFEKDDLGDLMLENVEALALGEWGSNVSCFGSGSVDCPINHVQVKFVKGSSYSLEELY